MAWELYSFAAFYTRLMWTGVVASVTILTIPEMRKHAFLFKQNILVEELSGRLGQSIFRNAREKVDFIYRFILLIIPMLK